ncbi:glycosyltransferase family protein [Skermanella pratensis]|uniref:glycosyltransferase family protein n=1 Tax=Skermanella pratensis TaxID=2233999 RepID=UPI001B3BE15B|nr:glycosyltransferase [Skermanella pratensis]
MTTHDIRPPLKTPLKALVWVQHLLGIGHVRRAALIARAMAAAGLDVTVASGGFPVSGVDYGNARVVQLPPARSADKSFKRLVGEGDRPLDDAWRERRRAALLDLADAVDPDILLLETYPFGRRPFRFELLPLLERPGRPRVVAASVRDILVAKDDPAREVEMADVARRHLDLVLVHGDPAVVPFDATFPQAHRIADLIRYTGYVAPARAPAHSAARPDGDGTGEVVVSVGGGAVGLPLLRTALAARPLTPLASSPWRLLAGPDIGEADFRTLRDDAPAGVTVERARPDFPELLSRCTLSISQAGYNTLMDLMQARCRAVVVPFSAGNETEQTDRARLFERRGLLHIVPEDGLTPERLAGAIGRALAAAPPAGFAPDVDGAAATARLLIEAAS